MFARIGKWFKDMRSELKKVQWPTRKQTVNNTVIVIICCIIVGICIWLFDALAGAVITALLDLFGKGSRCDMADNAKWYVVHTYSGYENTVAPVSRRLWRTAASKFVQYRIMTRKQIVMRKRKLS